MDVETAGPGGRREAKRVVVVNYGLGNLGSIVNMLRKIGATPELTSDPAVIEGAERLILPGVGAFDHGMERLGAMGLIDVLERKVLGERTPIMGLCLGMQLLAQRSEEGRQPGLGWIDADVVRFDLRDQPGLKIPHMGWNTLQLSRSHPVFPDDESGTRYYFVHSYHLVCRDPSVVVGRTRYGYDFDAAVARDNIIGVQFHPEKSHRFGMRLLRGFLGFLAQG